MRGSGILKDEAPGASASICQKGLQLRAAQSYKAKWRQDVRSLRAVVGTAGSRTWDGGDRVAAAAGAAVALWARAHRRGRPRCASSARGGE